MLHRSSILMTFSRSQFPIGNIHNLIERCCHPPIVGEANCSEVFFLSVTVIEYIQPISAAI